MINFAWNIGNLETPCYVTVMKAKDIFSISKVSRVEEDNEVGFQRTLSDKRVSDIAEYLDNGNIIPGSIILSAQGDFSMSFDDTTQELTLTPNDSYLFVIDGQHRLAGANKADSEILLPVCIFSNLELPEEVQYFLDINSNQKGVPKTLRIELLKFLSEPDSKDEILIRLFKDLGEDVSSALFGKISTTKYIPGKITHVPFKASVEPLIENNTLKKFNYKDKKSLLINYINAVSNILILIEGDNKRLTSSAFFQAVFKVFESVCEYSLSYYKNYKQDSFEEILIGIKNINFEKFSGSNEQTISQLEEEINTLLEIHIRNFSTPTDLL